MGSEMEVSGSGMRPADSEEKRKGRMETGSSRDLGMALGEEAHEPRRRPETAVAAGLANGSPAKIQTVSAGVRGERTGSWLEETGVASGLEAAALKTEAESGWPSGPEKRTRRPAGLGAAKRKGPSGEVP
jgi:hypothetical protein